jgi:hypothetical protein
MILVPAKYNTPYLHAPLVAADGDYLASSMFSIASRYQRSDFSVSLKYRYLGRDKTGARAARRK